MNRITEFAFGLVENLLSLFFIIFSINTTSEKPTHTEKEIVGHSPVKQKTFSEEYQLTELATGLVGSILGILTIMLAVASGATGFTFNLHATFFGSVLNFVSPVFAVLAIVGVVLARHKPKLGGWLIIISAVVGFMAIPFLYLPSGIPLLTSGFMGLQRGDQNRAIME